MRVPFFDLVLEVPEGVYKPREDTLLLARNIKLRGGERVLDVGTGSGALALLAASSASRVIATDKSHSAIMASSKNAKINGLDLSFLVADLLSCIKGQFDLIIFNPPYLPVDDGNLAWSGGADGRGVISRFAADAKRCLARNGRILLLMSSLTGLQEVKNIFTANGFEVRVCDEQKIPFERLYVLEIFHKC
jgi:release factor glutamine methyltransferase